MRKGSIKNTRINNEVLKEVSIMIHGELSDPRISPMTTVAHVEVTTDLKTCKIYVAVMGGSDEEKTDTINGLNSAKGYIRRELAHRINLRNTPEITFVLDETTEYGNHLMSLIDEVCKTSKED